MNQQVTHIPSPFKRWYRGHFRALKEGLKMPLMAPWSSLFTVITLGICLFAFGDVDFVAEFF